MHHRPNDLHPSVVESLNKQGYSPSHPEHLSRGRAMMFRRNEDARMALAYAHAATVMPLDVDRSKTLIVLFDRASQIPVGLVADSGRIAAHYPRDFTWAQIEASARENGFDTINTDKIK